MSIIEIYKDDISTVWNDSKTFLSVFDEKGKQIADYDFSTGLKLLRSENSIIVYILSDDLVSGKWKFVGTKIKQNNNKIIEEKISASGSSNEGPTKQFMLEKDPWNQKRIEGSYVSAENREKRINICRSCILFNHLDGTCKSNGAFVIESTKNEYGFCPEGKWGDKEKSIKKISENPEGEVAPPKNFAINEKEQEDFEKELEEYLKELE